MHTVYCSGRKSAAFKLAALIAKRRKLLRRLIADPTVDGGCTSGENGCGVRRKLASDILGYVRQQMELCAPVCGLQMSGRPRLPAWPGERV